MSALEQKLAAYAAYHRDGRNIAAHMLGIPLIVFAVEILLSRPAFGPFTPAMLAAALAIIYYFTLDAGFALILAILLGLGAWAGLALAGLPTLVWLGLGVGLFVIGWVFQLIGHAYEGRKPAFLDDLVNLLIGPLFIVAEAAFWLGLRRPLKSAIEGQLHVP